MKKTITATLVLTTLLLSSGCGLSLPWVNRPAGRESYQQLRATHFDPYPDANAGPAIPEGRPLQFQVQRSQPTRSQWQLDAE